MALVSTLAPTFTLAFRDNNNKDSSMLFHLPTTVVTLADALTAANAIRDAVAPLTNARMLGGSVSYPLTEDAPIAFVPESEVERKLVLPFTSSGRTVYSASLPSVIFGVEQSGTDIVDISNLDVAALITAVTANAVSNRGEALTGPLVGQVYVTHRNRRRS